MIQFRSFVRFVLFTLTLCIKYVILPVMSVLLVTDCRVFHLGKEELGAMLNSGAVLQRRALFHLKMHPGQCHIAYLKPPVVTKHLGWLDTFFYK